MTKAELRKKYRNLQKQTNQLLSNFLEAAIESGAVDLKPIKDGGWGIAKNFIYAALDYAKWNWEPIMSADKKMAKRIYRMTNPPSLT